MNKEELCKIDDILIKIYNSDLLTGKELNMLTEWINEPRDKIDKAIEYIENNQLYEEEWDYDSNDEPYSWGCNDTNATNELLSILRGEDNES